MNRLAALGGTLVGVAAVGAVGWASTARYIEPGSFGVEENFFAGGIQDKVVMSEGQGGFAFTTPVVGNFRRLPASPQNLSLDNASITTSDKANTNADGEVTWRINPEVAPKTLLNFGNRQEIETKLVTPLSRAAWRNMANEFTLDTLQSDQGKQKASEAALKQLDQLQQQQILNSPNLRQAFCQNPESEKPQCTKPVDFIRAQVASVDTPPEVLTSRNRTVVAIQQQETERYNAQAAKVEGEVSTIQAETALLSDQQALSKLNPKTMVLQELDTYRQVAKQGGNVVIDRSQYNIAP